MSPPAQSAAFMRSLKRCYCSFISQQRSCLQRGHWRDAIVASYRSSSHSSSVVTGEILLQLHIAAAFMSPVSSLKRCYCSFASQQRSCLKCGHWSDDTAASHRSSFRVSSVVTEEMLLQGHITEYWTSHLTCSTQFITQALGPAVNYP